MCILERWIIILAQPWFVSFAMGWGFEGHLITAMIANAFLNQNGRMLIGEILGPKALELEQPFFDAATWADQIPADSKYSWSCPLHYWNPPDDGCDWVKLAEDVSSGRAKKSGIIGAIDKFGNQLTDLNGSEREQNEALKFLIHFLSDVNQPLHLGKASDKGGNTIVVRPPWDHDFDKGGNPISIPRSTSLHKMWDSHIIQFMYSTVGGGKLEWRDLADILIDEVHSGGFDDYIRPSENLVYHAVSRAEASWRLAREKVYVEQGRLINSSDKLSLKYYEESAEVVQQQLVKSGLDIAHILNSIAQHRLTLRKKKLKKRIFGKNRRTPL